MKIRNILGITLFIVMFIIGKLLCDFIIPDNWDFLVAFMIGELNCCIISYLVLKEMAKK